MAPQANKITTMFLFFGQGPSFLVEVVPGTWGKQELVGEGETKISVIGWPKTSPACGGWRASPLSLISARSGM